MAALSLVGLLSQRRQRLPQAVLRRGAGAAVDRLVGVGGGVEGGPQGGHDGRPPARGEVRMANQGPPLSR